MASDAPSGPPGPEGTPQGWAYNSHTGEWTKYGDTKEEAEERKRAAAAEAAAGGDGGGAGEPTPQAPTVNVGPSGLSGGFSEGSLGGGTGYGGGGGGGGGGGSIADDYGFNIGDMTRGGAGSQNTLSPRGTDITAPVSGPTDGYGGPGIGFPGQFAPTPPGGFTYPGGGTAPRVTDWGTPEPTGRTGGGGGGGAAGGDSGGGYPADFPPYEMSSGGQPGGTGQGGGAPPRTAGGGFDAGQFEREQLSPGTISGVNRLVESYNKAFGEAKSANEARYQQLLGITDETTGQRAADIRGRGEEERSDLQQGLARTGLSNTTVSPTLTVGSKRRESEALNRLADQLQGTKLGIIERRTDAFPDPAALQSSLSKLGEGYGSGGMETLFNALANIDQSSSGALPGVTPVQSLQQVAPGGTAQPAAPGGLAPAGAAPYIPGGGSSNFGGGDTIGFPGGGFNEQTGTYGPKPVQRKTGSRIPTF